MNDEDLPTIEPEDEVDQYDAYERLNPRGYRELVLRGGRRRPQEETLNELAGRLSDILNTIE
jgi:hypothetical protein